MPTHDPTQIDRPTESSTDRPTDPTSHEIDRSTDSTGRRGITRALTSTAIGLVAVLALSESAPSGARAPTPIPPKTVRTAPAEQAPPTRTAWLQGTVRAGHRAVLAFTSGGRLERRPVELGDRVRRGALLARLELAPLEHGRAAAAARLRDVDARLAQAERDRARAERLGAAGAAGTETVERARAATEAGRANRSAARAALDEAERRLREASLRAPFDGVVRQVRLEVGETAAPGAPVLALEAEGGLEIEIGVPESIRRDLVTEAPVEVRWPLAPETPPIVGRLSAVGHAAGPSGLFPVIVALPDGARARPGFTAELGLVVATPDSLLAPVGAVASPSGAEAFVHVVDAGRVRRVPVQVLGLHGDRARLRAPLEVGAPLVVRGPASLLPGDAVEVLR